MVRYCTCLPLAARQVPAAGVGEAASHQSTSTSTIRTDLAACWTRRRRRPRDVSHSASSLPGRVRFLSSLVLQPPAWAASATHDGLAWKVFDEMRASHHGLLPVWRSGMGSQALRLLSGLPKLWQRGKPWAFPCRIRRLAVY
ncbi:hypothetical protein DAI22_04g068650 [Oryza sativa Japonica Group]|nr:hypothetical protein DAI22_04g068650 [Oryza sativa Japonica Group]